LQELAQEFARAEALLDERARLLRSEAQALEDEIRKLRTGDREASYEAEAPQAAHLRRLLRAELGLSANEVVYLCSDAANPRSCLAGCRGCVLGHNRFTCSSLRPLWLATALPPAPPQGQLASARRLT
jgi:hypothetical protein